MDEKKITTVKTNHKSMNEIVLQHKIIESNVKMYK